MLIVSSFQIDSDVSICFSWNVAWMAKYKLLQDKIRRA